jgi:hypothetical protein
VGVGVVVVVIVVVVVAVLEVLDGNVVPLEEEEPMVEPPHSAPRAHSKTTVSVV